MRRFVEAFWGALCALSLLGCGGSEFSAAPAGVGGTSQDGGAGTSGAGSGGGGGIVGSSGSSGSGGSGNTGGVGSECSSPDDCSDGDPCTVDTCGANGRCVPGVPRCGATEKCCDGACAECCGDTDCDDGNSCTNDRCFSGACTHAPDDTRCEPGQYCSVDQGCRVRELCSGAGVCDDDNACTTDRCVNDRCFHDYCASGTVCCPDGGCAQCCNDSQCPSPDPCKKGVCNSGQCTQVDRCPGKKCCTSGSSATCGTCCNASECSDNVACTDDRCAAGSCSNTPNSANCPLNHTCDPARGCVRTAECSIDSDCPVVTCQTARCDSGTCIYSGCGANLRCCTGVGCRACCQNSDCNDGVACTDDTCQNGSCRYTPNNANCSSSGTEGTLRCDPQLGCIGCVNASECQDTDLCTTAQCVQNRCVFTPTICAVGQICCPATGSCSQCCSDCDCGGIIASEEQPAIPPIEGCLCSNGICTYSPVCSC